MCEAYGIVQGAKDAARKRFDLHRGALARNPTLRSLYSDWYARVGKALQRAPDGPVLEIGSGPGFAREFLPKLLLSDVVPCPWLDVVCGGETLPFADGGLSGMVLFDVLHHLARPSALFSEAERVLRPGGRVVICEPYLSPLSYPVYRFLHEEGADPAVDPFDMDLRGDKDPFAGNQAIASVMLEREKETFAKRFPQLYLMSFDRFAGPSYPATGGFSRPPLIPSFLLRALRRVEDRLPSWLFAYVGFRMLAVVVKRGL